MKLDKAKLLSLAERIKASHTVADLVAFPECAGKSDDKAKQALFLRLHPDQYMDDDEDHAVAGELFRTVARIFADANGSANSEAETAFVVRGKSGVYAARSQIATGTVAAVFRGVGVEGPQTGKPVCIKVAIDPDDNELIDREYDVISGIKSWGVPEVFDRIEHESGSAGIVMELINGVDLYALRDGVKHKNGVKDHFHVGWFLERGLHTLGKLHENMIVHGNVEPGHLMIVPEEHRIVLLDFCFSAKKPKVRDKIGVLTENFSAPEVEAKGRPHPAMDLYGLGMCAIYLLGGDVVKKKLPKDVDPRLVRFINELVEADPEYRASDAYVMANRIWMTRKQIWGKFGFVQLEV